MPELTPRRVFLFDFDGLLIDSETAGLVSWQELYAQYGQELDLDHWYAEITAGRGPCMPIEPLERAVGQPMDWDTLEPRRRARRDELIQPRPGVVEFVLAAVHRGIRCAVVSNAPDWWLDEQLARTGLDVLPFEFVLTKDPGRSSKPAPDSYLAALSRLDITPAEAVAFEDSPSGINAAIAAGVYCVAVPNDVTRELAIDQADRVVSTLDGCDPAMFLADSVGVPSTTKVRCTVNGALRSVEVPTGMTLAEHLTDGGTPINVGCAEGTCGSCLVRLDDQPVRACTVLAAQTDGSEVTTVHGTEIDRGLADAAAAISAEGGLQCGFCTPAFVLVLSDLLQRGIRPDSPELPALLSVVTCRCTGYVGLLLAARRLLAGESAPEAPVRREDTRLLAGRGGYVGARSAPGQLWARFVRSPQPHAEILGVHIEHARAWPGVASVVTAKDLPATARVLGSTDASKLVAEPTLADTEVRYVGQPIAAVIADDPRTAADAAEAVRVSYRPRAAHEPEVRQTLQEVGDVDWALDVAAIVLHQSFEVGRHTGMPLETRGLLVEPEDGGLLLHGLTKQVRANRNRIADMLGIRRDQVRVRPVDVGGAFGVKGEFYPEDVVVPWSSVRLGRPVKWLEDRAEHLLATNHSRQQYWDVRLAADADGRLLAALVELVVDGGAYHRRLTDLMPTFSTAMFPGPYRLPHYRAVAVNRYTHKTPTGPYRAPGRFEANFVRERALDLLADRLGLDPTELRRRNLLRADELPYEPGTSCEGRIEYDEGDYLDVLAPMRVESEPAPPPLPGFRRGNAVLPFVEKAGVGAEETATVRLEPSGRVTVEVDSASSGQGHETVFCELAGRTLGLPPGCVDVAAANASPGAHGLGTFASRTALMTGNAVLAASEELAGQLNATGAAWRQELPALAARLTPEQRTATTTFHTAAHSYPYGAIAVTVDVDVRTFRVRVLRVRLTCDVGVVLNPTIVRGQLIGGIVQGIGGALLENLPYTSEGMPLARRLADYPLPLAADVPDIDLVLLDGRARVNPLGVRGVGEVGTAIAGAAVASAVAAAIPEIAAVTRLPLTPSALHDCWVRARQPELCEGAP